MRYKLEMDGACVAQADHIKPLLKDANEYFIPCFAPYAMRIIEGKTVVKSWLDNSGWMTVKYRIKEG